MTSLPNVTATTAQTKVFISHASEDKPAFVRPLAKLLEEFGIKVWFDEFTIDFGNSILRSIDNGLRECDYGIIVISKSFLTKPWPEYEFTGLMSRSINSHQSLLIPIWLNVTREEVEKYSLVLADMKSIQGHNRNLRDVIRELLSRIDPQALISFRAATESENHKENSTRIPLETINTIPASPVPLRLPGRDAIRAILAESAFPMNKTIDLMGMFNDLSKDAHYSRELEIHETLAATYLLVKSESNLNERELYNLRQYIILISSGASKFAEEITLPHNLKTQTQRYLKELGRIAHLKQVSVSDQYSEGGSNNDLKPHFTALLCINSSNTSKTLIKHLNSQIAEANSLGESGDIQGAIDILDNLSLKAIELEGIPGKYSSIIQGNYAYWIGISGDYAKAVSLFRDISTLRRNTLGPFDQTTLSARSNLAYFLHRQRSYRDSCDEWESIFDDASTNLGKDNEWTLRSIQGLTDTLYSWIKSTLEENTTVTPPSEGEVTRLITKIRSTTVDNTDAIPSCLCDSEAVDTHDQADPTLFDL